jgi:hypothetical protein
MKHTAQAFANAHRFVSALILQIAFSALSPCCGKRSKLLAIAAVILKRSSGEPLSFLIHPGLLSVRTLRI